MEGVRVGSGEGSVLRRLCELGVAFVGHGATDVLEQMSQSARRIPTRQHSHRVLRHLSNQAVTK